MPYNTYLLDIPSSNLLGFAYSINKDGTVVGNSGSPGKFVGMVWSPAAVQLDLAAGALVTFASGINDFGTVVGSYEFDLNDFYPFVRHENGEVQDLKDAFPEGGFASDINNSGRIVGSLGTFEPTKMRAFLYDYQTEDEPTNLGVLPGHDTSQAIAVNNNGQAVGQSGVSPSFEGAHGFMYDGSLIDLGAEFIPEDINDQGLVVGIKDNTSPAICDTAAGTLEVKELGALPSGAYRGYAHGINSKGDVVGEWQGNERRAFVCLAGKSPVDLNELIVEDSGWLLETAEDINDDGCIAGYGIYNGKEQPYLLCPAVEQIGWSKIIRYVMIDPLTLILPGEIYVAITKPNPPPIATLASQISESVKRLSPLEKRIVRSKLAKLKTYVGALEKGLKSK
jgi:uncharacterized membrane protein